MRKSFLPLFLLSSVSSDLLDLFSSSENEIFMYIANEYKKIGSIKVPRQCHSIILESGTETSFKVTCRTKFKLVTMSLARHHRH